MLYMFRTILVHHQEQLLEAVHRIWYMPVPYVWLWLATAILLVYIHIVSWCTVRTTSKKVQICWFSKIFVLVWRVPFGVQLSEDITSLTRNDCVGWRQMTCCGLLEGPHCLQVRGTSGVSCWARLFLTEAVWFFEMSGPTQPLRHRHIPEAAVLSYSPIRTSTVHYFCVLNCTTPC